MLIKSKLTQIARFIQKSRIIGMKKFDPVVRVVDAGPVPAGNREVLQKLIKKAALRKLRQMQYEAQRKAS
jgi:hypothetical protein